MILISMFIALKQAWKIFVEVDPCLNEAQEEQTVYLFMGM